MTTFNHHTFKCVDSIDADLFSSDVFERSDRAEEFQKYLDRWQRKINMIRAELTKKAFVKGMTVRKIILAATQNEFGCFEMESPNYPGRLLECIVDQTTGDFKFEFAGEEISESEVEEILKEWNEIK